jgi:hypothetical protein
MDLTIRTLLAGAGLVEAAAGCVVVLDGLVAHADNRPAIARMAIERILIYFLIDESTKMQIARTRIAHSNKVVFEGRADLESTLMEAGFKSLYKESRHAGILPHSLFK